jgi:hypothetical protein
MKQERHQTDKHSREDQWTQRLRDHLADIEAPVPDDLWEKIEARLPKEVASPTPKKEARIVPLWARWAAAAVIVGGLVILWNVKSGMWNENSLLSSKSETTKKTSAEKTPALMKSEKSEESESSESIEQGVKVPTLLAEEMPMESEKKVEETPLVPISSEEKPNEPILPVSSEEKSNESIQPISSEKKPNDSEKSPENVIRELNQKIAAYKQRRSGSATINLYASNGFGNQSYRNGVLMSQELLSNYDYYRNPDSHGTRVGDSPVYLANHEERQNFYQPISFGLSVNIPISSKFSVSTGVVYTRLSSDFTSIANSLVYERQQKLHYVGIPLTVQYNVWQWHGLNVYATAGGQADFNVKAYMTTEGTETKLEKDNWQWSVNAALGVQYNFIPQLGIYVEPGIKHYFDNGSHIQNYFKHRPTNFNLQIGLRLNMGKK